MAENRQASADKRNGKWYKECENEKTDYRDRNADARMHDISMDFQWPGKSSGKLAAVDARAN